MEQLPASSVPFRAVTCGSRAAKLEEALRRLLVPSGVALTEALSPQCVFMFAAMRVENGAKRFHRLQWVRKEGRRRNCGCRDALKALHGRRKAHRWAPQRASHGQNGHSWRCLSLAGFPEYARLAGKIFSSHISGSAWCYQCQ